MWLTGTDFLDSKVLGNVSKDKIPAASPGNSIWPVPEFLNVQYFEIAVISLRLFPTLPLNSWQTSTEALCNFPRFTKAGTDAGQCFHFPSSPRRKPGPVWWERTPGKTLLRFMSTFLKWAPIEPKRIPRAQVTKSHIPVKANPITVDLLGHKGLVLYSGVIWYAR